MQHLQPIRGLALLGLAVLALAACAPAAGAGTAANAGTPVHSPVSTPTGTPTAAPTAGSTPTASAPTAGAVTLVLNKTSYGPNDIIQVTIKNGLKTMIFAADHRTNCTMVQLQHLDNGTWQAVGMCRLETVTRIVSLNAGSAALQVLAPGNGPNATGPWPAGTYRVAFGYQAGGVGASAQQQLVYSATFVVN